VWYSHGADSEGTKWQQVDLTATVTAYCLIDVMVQQVAPQCITQMQQPIPSKGVYKKELVNCFFTCFFGSGEWATDLVDITKGLSPDKLAEAWAAALGTLDGLISVGNPTDATMCLDVSGGQYLAGNQLDIWPCQDSNPNEQFFVTNNSIFW
jgi:hypothetical protein